MIEIILTSSVLILILILLRRLLRGRIAPGLQYALWLLAAARLLIPGTLFTAPVSVMGATADLQVAIEAAFPAESIPPVSSGEAIAAVPERVQDYGDTVVTSLPPSSVTDVAVRRINWLDVTWKAGIAVVGTAFLLSNAVFYGKLRRRRQHLAYEKIPLRVYLVPGLSSPCLFGVLRPAIYLNEAALEGDHLEYILIHEQTHYRHGDHLWSILRSICLAVHWYNPLVWWAAALSRRDCELACDDGAIRRLGEDRRLDYGATLVEMVAAPASPAALFRASTTMTASKRTMTERIRLIAQRPRMLKITLAAVVLLICGAVLVTFGGEAKAGGDSSDDPPVQGGVSEAAYLYTHSSGQFSLTLPGNWKEDVTIVETGDNVSFFEANTYAQAGYGWLMSVSIQSSSWVEANAGEHLYVLGGPEGASYQYILEYRLSMDFSTEPAAEPYIDRFQALLDQRQEVADGFRLLSPRPDITQADAQALYQRARTAWDWFDLELLPTTGDTLSDSLGSYQRVDGFDSLEELRAYLLTLFSPELTDHLLTAYQPLREAGGALFVQSAGRGRSIYAGENTITVFLYDQWEQSGYAGHVYAVTEVLDENDLTTVLYGKRHDWFFAWNGENYVFTSFGPLDDVDPQRYYNALSILDHYERGSGTATWLPLLWDLDWNALHATSGQWPEGFDLGLYVIDSLSQYIAEQGRNLSGVAYRDILSATDGLDGAYSEGFSAIVWQLYAADPQQFAQVVLEDLTAAQRQAVASYLGYELAYRMREEESLSASQVADRLERTLAGDPVSVVPSTIYQYFSRAGESFRLLPVGVQGVYSADYTSADPSVAAVDGTDGTVTAVSPGETTISLHVECSAGQYDFTCTVVYQ